MRAALASDQFVFCVYFFFIDFVFIHPHTQKSKGEGLGTLMATERDHCGRSIVRVMLDLDDVSPDGYNVQGLRHAGRQCASF
jgi:hypothetical protein